MKIISKFHDYYDIGSSMGVDESIVYVRNSEMVELSNDDLPMAQGYYSEARHVDRVDHILRDVLPNTRRSLFGSDTRELINFVGFCGVLYPFVYTRYYDKNGREQENFYFEASEEAAIALDRTHSLRYYSRWMKKDDYKKSTLKNLETLLALRIPAEDLFHRLKTPVFILPQPDSMVERKFAGGYIFDREKKTYDPVYINPSLKELGFYRVVDPFTAYQEISMYITGVLGVNKVPPVQISDVHMRDAKGFDERSFKKEPTKKRKKK